jgi:integrase
MSTVKLVLVQDRPTKEGKYPIRLRFAANSKRSDVNLDVFVDSENWDAKEMYVLPGEQKYKAKNIIIQEAFDKAEDFIKDLNKKNRFINDAKQLRDLFCKKEESVMFLDRLYELAQRRGGKTKETYIGTWNKLKAYTKDDIYFEDITQSWLEDFDNWCVKEGNRVNTRGIHFRNMRAVFNAAINDRVISADLYPFRSFKISVEETEKRTLTLIEFQKLLAYNGSIQENWARDVFLLSFYLLGINMKDLFSLEPVENEEVKYRRHKTHKLFNIAMEPETLVLIERYKGSTSLLNFSNTIAHHENFRKKVNRYLKKITEAINKEEAKNKSEFRIREFTTYAARHSWATFAGELDIADKTISMAMGHESDGNTTTNIYIQFNHKKVIEANRKVIDYVLNKKGALHSEPSSC